LLPPRGPPGLRVTMNVDVMKPGTVGRSRFHDNTGDRDQSVEEYFKVNLFIPLLDGYIRHLEDRFGPKQAKTLSLGHLIPDTEIIAKAQVPRVLREETEFDVATLNKQFNNIETMNHKQSEAFQKVVASVNKQASRIICLNNKAESSKTYTFNLLLEKLWYEGKIALTTAMSGITATLLENGQTHHSCCKVPLGIKEESTCAISLRSQWVTRHIFECLDRSLTQGCQTVRQAL